MKKRKKSPRKPTVKEMSKQDAIVYVMIATILGAMVGTVIIMNSFISQKTHGYILGTQAESQK
jgi:hypothetical protein